MAILVNILKVTRPAIIGFPTLGVFITTRYQYGTVGYNSDFIPHS